MSGTLVVVSITLKSMSGRKVQMVLKVEQKGSMGSVIVFVHKFVTQMEKILVQWSVKPISNVLKD
jgi:hypothetical protein